MLKLAKFILLFVLFVVVAFCTIWASLALWFKLPGPDIVRWCVVGAFALFGAATLVAMFKTVRWRWLLLFSLSMVAVLGWWNTLLPPSEGDWAAEVQHQVTGTIDGDTLTLNNVRAFEWRTADDFTEHWVTRTYDISQIESVDLFLSFWGAPDIGHFMVSFGFSDGRYLALSNEVRRSVNGSFSPIADFFKANPIVMIASEEYDVVGVRSNIRNERVQIFRIKSEPARRREFLKVYVEAANELKQKPLWFNSVFTNCSRSAVLLARHVGAKLPADWRVLVNGYLPDYLFELGALGTEVPLEELFRLGDITERANTVGLTDAFSAAIREGVPKP